MCSISNTIVVGVGVGVVVMVVVRKVEGRKRRKEVKEEK
jgi:hypothetical protein